MILTSRRSLIRHPTTIYGRRTHSTVPRCPGEKQYKSIHGRQGDHHHREPGLQRSTFCCSPYQAKNYQFHVERLVFLAFICTLVTLGRGSFNGKLPHQQGLVVDLCWRCLAEAELLVSISNGKKCVASVDRGISPTLFIPLL